MIVQKHVTIVMHCKKVPSSPDTQLAFAQRMQAKFDEATDEALEAIQKEFEDEPGVVFSTWAR